MRTFWLNNKKSNKLILFFNGWSLDENCIKHLEPEDFDVLMFYDYTTLDIEEKVLDEIKTYDEVNIISFSMGVWAAAAVMDNFNNIKMTTAINGTLVPVSDEFGIPVKIFNLTLSNLSELTYPRFFKNMFADFKGAEHQLHKIPKRSVEDQKKELLAIKDFSAKNNYTHKISRFDRIIISNNDKIIPAKNQIKFWSQRQDLKIIRIDDSHCIFNSFSTCNEIVNYGK